MTMNHGLNADFIGIDIRCEPDVIDPCICHRLHPDCLPDPCRAGIKYGYRLLQPILLASRQPDIPAVILCPDHNIIGKAP
ncbi:hypothetical protein D3C71_1817460 [compost metagenome]